MLQSYNAVEDHASILARLIEFAYLPSPPPSLPPAWQQAFDAGAKRAQFLI
jgi:hypothetical protein